MAARVMFGDFDLQTLVFQELDLTNAASFRDFSKAMGAQTPERLEQFMKRYREWDDPTGT